MFKKGLALALAAAIALTFAGCANSSDSGAAIFAGGTGTGNGGGSAVPKGPLLSAEAIEGGIKFTIKALGAKYNNENDCFVYSKETEPCDIGRFYPEWSDKTKEWTGVYPYVSAGQKYKFALHVNGLQEETVEVTATGGLGQIPYDENTGSCISVDDTGIDVFVDKARLLSFLPE